ncbi:MAG: hypothetical protein FWH37_03250 [Candidatus Bathyarchaeota archaeon]|nr:hypothetical protein [Candidatus Termiticorpusculum sp.]
MKLLIKDKRGKFLIAVGMTFLFVIFATLVLPAMLFPLRMNVSGHVFHVGDTMSGTVTFTNKSGCDVNVVSHMGNGYMSCLYTHNLRYRGNHVHLLLGYEAIMKAGDKESIDFKYEFTEPGIYLVDAHSYVSVNNYPIWNRQYSIAIVLK